MISQSKRNKWTFVAFVLLGLAVLFFVAVYSASLGLATRRWCILGHVVSIGVATGAAAIAWHNEADHLRPRIIIESVGAMFLAATLALWRW